MSDGAILIFGMPRSGTTWLGKLFDSHPAVLYRHEPDSWRKFTGVPLLPSDPHDASMQQEVTAFEASMANTRAQKVCGKTPLFPKSYMSPTQYLAYKAGVRLSQVAASAGFELNVAFAPRRLATGARLVWKSIESVGRLGLVLESLAGSMAILLVRHPCGYIASVLRGESQLRFEDNRGASEDYGIMEQLLDTPLAKEEGLNIDYLRSLTPVERLAWRWVLFNDKAMRDTQDSDRCSIVRYEDVCADPYAQMRSLFSSVGLEWPLQTEAFIRQSTTQQDNAYYSVFKDPAAAAERWRKELPPETVARIMAVARDTLPGSLFRDTSPSNVLA